MELWQVLPSAADDYMYMYSSSKLQVEFEMQRLMWETGVYGGA